MARPPTPPVAYGRAGQVLPRPKLTNPAANQAVLIWATCGSIIGLGVRPRDQVRVEDAQASISTGVIAHTMQFLERFDVSQWLLVRQEATRAATGRVYGEGRVFTEDGPLVATFHRTPWPGP